jgi:uncharacterized SAM-binding protein YcdF (DUF218 family)
VKFVLSGIFRAVRWVSQRFWIALGLVVAYFVVTGVQVWMTSRHSDAVPAQAVVVMGAAEHAGVPSSDLAARLQDAADLWHRHLTPLVVVTGARPTGDRFSASAVAQGWLVAHGVTASDIVQAGGTGSWSDLAGAAAVLHQRGLARVLVVTDSFHEDRTLAIATQLGLHARPVPPANSPIKGWATVPYFAKETVGVAVGRVVGYSRLPDLGPGVVSFFG